MGELKRKIVFERDYTAGLERLDDDDLTPENVALVLAALKRQSFLERLPYVVNEVAAAQFDSMITACDELAKASFGKLAATINYTSHEAVITLECVYLGFDTSKFMDILRKIAATALQVRFEPLTSGFLRLTLIMPYFMPYISATDQDHHYL